MSVRVVELKTRTIELNESVIKMLRDFLEQAERGEIVAAVIAAVTPSGASITEASGSDHLQTLLGAMSILQHRMIEGRHCD